MSYLLKQLVRKAGCSIDLFLTLSIGGKYTYRFEELPNNGQPAGRRRTQGHRSEGSDPAANSCATLVLRANRRSGWPGPAMFRVKVVSGTSIWTSAAVLQLTKENCFAKAYISTAEAPPREDSRIPFAHENQGWPQSACSPPQEGPSYPHTLVLGNTHREQSR